MTCSRGFATLAQVSLRRVAGRGDRGMTKRRLKIKFMKRSFDVQGEGAPWIVHRGPATCPMFCDGCWCVPRRIGKWMRLFNQAAKTKKRSR